jgi:hypothetical protein
VGPPYPFQNFYIFAGSNSYNIASTEAIIVSRTTQSMQVHPVLRIGKLFVFRRTMAIISYYLASSLPPLSLESKQTITHLICTQIYKVAWTSL